MPRPWQRLEVPPSRRQPHQHPAVNAWSAISTATTATSHHRRPRRSTVTPVPARTTRPRRSRGLKMARGRATVRGRRSEATVRTTSRGWGDVEPASAPRITGPVATARQRGVVRLLSWIGLGPPRGRGAPWRTRTSSMSPLGWQRLANDSMPNQTRSIAGASPGCCPKLAGRLADSLPGVGGVTSRPGHDVGVGADGLEGRARRAERSPCAGNMRRWSSTMPSMNPAATWRP
jgi:hypothetical protein